MKKTILTLLTLIVLAVLILFATMYFIPQKLIVAVAVKVNGNSQAVYRSISSDSNWYNWGDSVPGRLSTTAISHSVTKKMVNGFDILTGYNEKKYSGNMFLIPVKRDSTIINWQLNIQSSNNPLQRIADYRSAVAIKKNMDQISNNMQNHLSIFENLYHFTLNESSTTDTIFISTKAISPKYPGTEFIYMLINKLKKFCNTQGCTVNGYPMLNITKIDSAHYQVRTALPVDRLMQDKEDISSGKMVRGKFIVTDVKGGTHAVDETLQQIRYYFQDYGRTSMAIPFSYLITDRQLEPDTSKWLTRIYAPVY